MRDQPLPAELNRFANLPDLTFRGSGEWSAACPQCGGYNPGRHDVSDRFRLFDKDNKGNARVWCRSCGFFEWADQDGEKPNADEIERTNQERARLANQDRERVAQKINDLRREAYWRGWHDAMGEQHRRLWRQQGISDKAQDYFQLGYVERRRFFNGAEPFYTPAMTIPIFEVGWEAVNIQYRLMEPPGGVGKYRFTGGLPAPLFITNPYSDPEGPTLLVEGAKKAMVTFEMLDLCIVAMPSKMSPAGLFKQIDKCDPVYVALDPDAYDEGRGSAAARAGKLLGDRARYVRLPVKPDDFFTQHGGTKDQFMSYVRQATRTIQ